MIANVLAGRYASAELTAIWSPEEKVRTERCHQAGPWCESRVMTVTAPRLTASETPSQIVHRKAKLASSLAPNSEKPSTWRVKTLPTIDSSATSVATITPTQAIRSAAWE